MHQIVEYRQFSNGESAWCVSTYPEYARGQEGRCTASSIVRFGSEREAREALDRN